jgi:hypothetical protein
MLGFIKLRGFQPQGLDKYLSSLLETGYQQKPLLVSEFMHWNDVGVALSFLLSLYRTQRLAI